MNGGMVPIADPFQDQRNRNNLQKIYILNTNTNTNFDDMIFRKSYNTAIEKGWPPGFKGSSMTDINARASPNKQVQPLSRANVIDEEDYFLDSRDSPGSKKVRTEPTVCASPKAGDA
mmetsp:Transcript_32428/g.29229  ORF Transcript_32428/g.29229 Transcript_32428/m.29229 type:complete len:117 (+) Transcript_32428:304-654(+)